MWSKLRKREAAAAAAAKESENSSASSVNFRLVVRGDDSSRTASLREKYNKRKYARSSLVTMKEKRQLKEDDKQGTMLC